ncbi:MAG TPA: neutral/alkaline non-lysosomal ceramidase N-terminal domain-containing protein, partial [Agriterribacter sp.]|nr:neutral/alkaline non-lysosomal ceramidase N-terminal domain-containing protein [Agriterribacter sp.]
AKAVVVANRRNALALVTIDCIGLPYPVVQQIRDAVELKLSPDVFDAAQIVVSSTHTHSGPDVIGIWGMDRAHTGTDSTYIRFLVKTTAEVIEKAWKRRQPATAKYANTLFGEGWVENVSDSSEIDRTVSIVQFTTPGGKNIATLTNFACHPTFLGRENTLVSADFPSGFYKQMKKSISGVNLYVQGAIGGWVQPEKVERTFEEAEKKGTALAGAVTAALKQAKQLEGAGISFASRRFEIPVNNSGFKQMTAAGVIRRDISEGTTTEIAWFTIGNAVFATHPGETSPLYAFATKKLMTNKGPKFVLGLGQDELGYILKPAFFDPGTQLHAAPYLTGMSPGEEAGAAMMQVLTELAERNGVQ